MKPSKRTVVITGLGTVTPLGNSLQQTWPAIVQGRSGIGPISVFDAATFPVRIAGEVRDFAVPPIALPPELLPLLGRSCCFCFDAARMALADAALDLEREDRARMGVALGGDEEYQRMSMSRELYHPDYMLAALQEGGAGPAYCELLGRSPHLSKIWALRKKADIGASCLALLHGLQGPVHVSHTSCSSSGHAIGKAKRLIESGDCDVMLCGGHCSMLSEVSLSGFHLLGTLSTRNDEPQRASRPFDRDRDGFVMGEGAAIMVLEDLEHARRRGARIYAVLAGYGSSSNSYRLTDTPPDGRGGDLSMQRALQDGGIERERVAYINAHGTGTLLNDPSETLSIKKVFGSQASRLLVSSTKSMIGHLVTASSAIELVVTVMAVHAQIAPPTANLDTFDPRCDLDYVPHTARDCAIDVALSNSFAFGGQNVTLAVARYRH